MISRVNLSRMMIQVKQFYTQMMLITFKLLEIQKYMQAKESLISQISNTLLDLTTTHQFKYHQIS
jgi:hypothetical protein